MYMYIRYGTTLIGLCYGTGCYASSLINPMGKSKITHYISHLMQNDLSQRSEILTYMNKINFMKHYYSVLWYHYHHIKKKDCP